MLCLIFLSPSGVRCRNKKLNCSGLCELIFSHWNFSLQRKKREVFGSEEVISLLKYIKAKLIFSMKINLGYPLAKMVFFSVFVFLKSVLRELWRWLIRSCKHKEKQDDFFSVTRVKFSSVCSNIQLLGNECVIYSSSYCLLSKVNFWSIMNLLLPLNLGFNFIYFF